MCIRDSEKRDEKTGKVMRDERGKIVRRTPVHFSTTDEQLDKVKAELSQCGLCPFTDIAPVLKEFGMEVTEEGGKEYS